MLLKKCCKILSGFAFKSSLFNSENKGIPIVRIRDVGETKSNTFYSGSYSEEYVLNNGDIIIGMDGQFKLAIWNGGNALLNQRVCKLTPNNKLIDKRFLSHILPKSLKEIEDKTPFVTVKHLSVKSINEIELPPYNLATQKHIADILDAADALRRKTQQIVDSYDELAQSLFLEMFGDPVSNPKRWELKTIESLIPRKKGAIKRGPFGGALKKEIFVETGYLVYEQFHALNADFNFERYYITEEKYNELIAFEVHPGDIIISCSGIYLGKLAIVPENAKKGIINQALLKVTLDQNKMTNTLFIFIFTNKNFKSLYFDSNRGAGIPNFPPMEEFKKFKFIAPPLDLQNQFAENIALIEQQKELAKQSLAESENLFNALLQKAFKGELVPEPQPAEQAV